MRNPWNKQDAQLAVAARERNRIERAINPPAERRRYVPRPRIRPDFIIRIESRRGERLQIAVHRLLGRVRTSDGQSPRQFCRGLEQLLTKSA